VDSFLGSIEKLASKSGAKREAASFPIRPCSPHAARSLTFARFPTRARAAFSSSPSTTPIVVEATRGSSARTRRSAKRFATMSSASGARKSSVQFQSYGTQRTGIGNF